MSPMLKPAAEFDYSPRVRQLFANLQHAGFLDETPNVLSISVGSREQGAKVRWWFEVRDARVQTVRYQAYGCPHFLAACESLACWLEERAITELPQWSWRNVEAELQVPANKRARLLLLEEALQKIAQRCVK